GLYAQWGLGALHDMVHGRTRRALDQLQPSRGHVDHRNVSDDAIHDPQPGEGQGAFTLDLRIRVFGAMVHNDYDAFGPGDEIHHTANPLPHLAGDHRIGDIPCLAALHGTQNGEIDVTAADHPETLGAVEDGGALHQRYGLFAGIDQVGILLRLVWEGADSQ